MRASILSNDEVQEKYIRICEGSIRVKIERGTHLLIEHFAIRKYKSLESAMVAAIAWRDKKHLEIFGQPVPNKIIHITPRTNRKKHINPETGIAFENLPAGISYGFHGERLRYVVVSNQLGNKTIRTRFPVVDGDLQAAIEKAIEFRQVLVAGNKNPHQPIT
jgi:hypothetical protein